MRVAVVGHVEWVEFIGVQRLPRPGEVAHAHSSFERAAGGGGVVAAVLTDLGADVDFYCALGRDATGEAAAEELMQRGIHLHVAWADGPTRRAVTMLEDGGERTIVTIGKRLEPSADDRLGWSRVGETAGVYFTAGDVAALGLARSAPVLVASPRARGALAEAAKNGEPAVDALVFSEHDRDEREWATQFAACARVLVATDGAAGGRWWGAEEGSWTAQAPPGPVRDSYGCGDSFAAGVMFGLASGRSIGEAVEVGASCGARNLTRTGAP